MGKTTSPPRSRSDGARRSQPRSAFFLTPRQAAQKGPDARRRPMVAREAYSLYVERAIEGVNEADGPFSAALLAVGAGQDSVQQNVHARRRVVELGVLSLVVRDAVAAGSEDH